MMDVNLKGMFLLSQAAAREMIKQGRGGKIINTSSQSAFKPHPDMIHYCASKAGVVSLTQSLGLELAPHNILVNAIAPGYYNTLPNQRFLKKEPGLYDRVLDMIPLGKLGNIEELAGLVVVLASDIANFMTGSTILIDGGYTCW